MIRRALKVKKRLQLFCLDEKWKAEIKNDILSEKDWDILERLEQALYHFEEATMYLQGRAEKGHHGAVWEVLPVLEYLLSELEKLVPHGIESKSNKSWQPIEVAAQNAWQKLQKYYEKTDNSHHIFAAAVLFNPAARIEYFNGAWETMVEQTLKQTMVKSVKEQWRDKYQQLDNSPPPPPAVLAAKRRSRSPTGIEKRTQEMVYRQRDPVPTEDVFDEYIYGRPIEPPNNIIKWWKNETRLSPSLRKQAMDLLAVPATSAEIERQFHSTGLLISDLRANLAIDAIEQSECLRRWEEAGLYQIGTAISDASITAALNEQEEGDEDDEGDSDDDNTTVTKRR